MPPSRFAPPRIRPKRPRAARAPCATPTPVLACRNKRRTSRNRTPHAPHAQPPPTPAPPATTRPLDHSFQLGRYTAPWVQSYSPPDPRPLSLSPLSPPLLAPHSSAPPRSLVSLDPDSDRPTDRATVKSTRSSSSLSSTRGRLSTLIIQLYSPPIGTRPSPIPRWAPLASLVVSPPSLSVPLGPSMSLARPSMLS